MKIIYISRFNIYFENSASSNRARSILEGLASLGAVVSILVTDGYLSKKEKSIDGVENNSIQIRYLSSLVNETLSQRRINRFLVLPILNQLLSRRIKQIVYSTPGSILWTGVELKYFKIVVALKNQYPALHTFLELSEYLDYQQYNKGNWIHVIESRARHMYFEKKAFFKYDGLALMTKVLLNYYQNFPNPRPSLLHLPMTVDLNRFKLASAVPEGFIRPYIAFVGVMNDAKDGVSILIQAFGMISHKFKDIRLYLVGGWNYDTPFHLKQIKELSLEERILWKGEYGRDDIPSIIQNACLLVLPRPNTKQTQGGFPTKLGEYLATGNPVCATRIGEIPEYLSDGMSAYFADADSVESFAETMDRALSNPDKAMLIGREGLRVAEKHFNMKKQSELLWNFFHNVLMIS